IHSSHIDHPSSPTRRSSDLLMLPDLLELLRKQGFTFASLAEIEQDPAYAQDPDAALKYGGTLPDQFMDSMHLKYPPFKPKPFDRSEGHTSELQSLTNIVCRL